MPKYIVSQPAITLCMESRSSRLPATTSAPRPRNACARSSSVRTIARTALPCFNSSSVTVRPTAPTRPAARVTRRGRLMPPCRSRRSSRAVPGFDGLDGVFKRLFQNAPADGPEHEAEQPSLEGLAFAYDDHVDVGQTIGTACEGVGVAGRASPQVGVGRREDDVVGIGPVVVQAFPDAARALGDVGLRGAAVMHLEVIVGAVAKKLRAARPEVS